MQFRFRQKLFQRRKFEIMNCLMCLGIAFAVLLCSSEAKSVTRCKFPGHPQNGHLSGDWINRLEDTILRVQCFAGYELKGAGQAVCKNGQWSATLGTCEAVKCQAVKKSPLSVADPPSCFTGPSSYGTLCRLSCPRGYDDNAALYCDKDGQWEGRNVMCKDHQRPNLECPPNRVTVVQSDPGKSTAKVRLPTPSYSDNSEELGGKLTFNATVDGKLVSVNQDVELRISNYAQDYRVVVYVVADEAGNKRRCTFFYRVEDKEPPKINYCPSNFTVTMGKDHHTIRVTWEEARATDNSGDPRVFCNRPNGAFFPEGTHLVKYVVSDRTGNKATCDFYITVKKPCIDRTDLPIASINPHIVLPDPSNACSFVAADLNKCDDAISPYVPNVFWKQICRKTCKVC